MQQTVFTVNTNCIYCKYYALDRRHLGIRNYYIYINFNLHADGSNVDCAHAARLSNITTNKAMTLSALASVTHRVCINICLPLRNMFVQYWLIAVYQFCTCLVTFLKMCLNLH